MISAKLESSPHFPLAFLGKRRIPPLDQGTHSSSIFVGRSVQVLVRRLSPPLRRTVLTDDIPEDAVAFLSITAVFRYYLSADSSSDSCSPLPLPQRFTAFSQVCLATSLPVVLPARSPTLKWIPPYR